MALVGVVLGDWEAKRAGPAAASKGQREDSLGVMSREGLLGQFRRLTWEQTAGPEGGGFTAVAVATSDPGIAYAGTCDGYLFKSANGGDAWELLRSYKSGYVGLIAVDPENPQVVFTACATVHRTLDGGATWQELRTPSGTTYQLAFDPADSRTIYVGTHPSRVYRSTDRGETWTRVGEQLPDDLQVTALAVGTLGEVLVAMGGIGESGAGFFHSDDGGSHWETLDFPNREEAYVSRIAMSAVDPAAMFIGLTSRVGCGLTHPVAKTSDGGKTWDPVKAFPFGEASAIMIASDGQAVFLSGAGRVCRTLDGGLTAHFLDLALPTGPGHGYEISAIAGSALNADVVFVATGLGIHRSQDGGDRWALATEGLIATRVSHVVADPVNPGRVYATSISGTGTFRTDDAGGSWTRIDSSGMPTLWADELVMHPRNPDRIYNVSDTSNIFSTDDSGGRWRVTQTAFRFSSVYAFALDPHDSDVIYASKNGYAIYKSEDGGRHWRILRESPDYTYSIAVAPSDPDVLYSGYNCKPFEDAGAIYRSADAGESWLRKELDLVHPSRNINAVVVDPLDADTLYVATMKNGVLKSSDGGDTWCTANVGLRSLDVLSLAIHPSDPGTLYAGLAEGAGVFKSIDAGETWQEVNTGIRIECPSFLQRVGQVSLGIRLEKSPTFISGNYYSIPWTAFTSIAIAPSDPETVYASDFHLGLYRSLDAGASWELTNGDNDELARINVRKIAVHPGAANTVFVSSDQGVFESTDGGRNWSAKATGLPTMDVHTVACGQGGRLYAGSKGCGVLRFEEAVGQWMQTPELGDWGQHWPVWNRAMYQYTALLIDPHDPQLFYVGTFPAGIFKSVDGGKTWSDKNLTFTNDGIMCMVVHPEIPDLIYTGTYNGVSRSLDGGESWEMISEGMPPELWVFSIAFDPTNPTIMYAAAKNGTNKGGGEDGFHGTVVKTTDGGNHWVEIVDGLDRGNEFYTIIAWPRNPSVLFLASQNDGVFVSVDAGASWSPLNAGLLTLVAGHGPNVAAPLTYSPTEEALYLGTYGFGVFRLDLAALPGAQPAITTHDLKLVALSSDVHNLVSGEEVTLTATLQNQGTSDICQEFDVSFTAVQGQTTIPLGSVILPGLKAGETRSAELGWTASPGIHAIRAEVDAARQIDETNEFNNDKEESIAVTDTSNVLFECDFEGWAPGWTDLGQAWRVEEQSDGNHVLRGNGERGTFIRKESFVADNVRVEMRFQLRSGVFSVYFRQRQSGAYVFNISETDLFACKFLWVGDRGGRSRPLQSDT